MITRSAEALGPNTHLTFHLSLDDPLLARHGASLKPLLEKLGLTEDEPIAHSFVTRAVAKSQTK